MQTGYTHLSARGGLELVVAINFSINVIVATSSAALLDNPPPIGTLVTITALNPGTGFP